jgi:hypothetical protein
MGTVTVIGTVAEAHYSGEDVPSEVTHPDTGETIATIGWHASDGWRGWYESTPVDGWEKVGEGANCGAWEDTPPGTSNDEVEAYVNGLAETHDEVVVVVCGGSNVFAAQFDVLARANSYPADNPASRLAALRAAQDAAGTAEERAAIQGQIDRLRNGLRGGAKG